MKISVVLTVTILNTVYSLPVWDTSKGSPPIFIKPMILPASCMRSTLSPELLKILGNAPPLSDPAAPSMDKDNPPPPPAASSYNNNNLNQFSAQPSSIDLLDMNKNLPNPNPNPNPNSDSIRPEPSSSAGGVQGSDFKIEYLNYERNPTASSPGAPPSVETLRSTHPDPTTNPSLESLFLSPPPASNPTTTLPVPSTVPASGSAASPTPSDSPFPGATLLPIEPVRLSQKCSQELSKLLSDIPTGSSQEPVQNQYPANTYPSNNLLQSLPAIHPVAPTSPSITLPSTVPQPSNVATANQQLNARFDYPYPDSNPKSLGEPVPSSTTKPTLDKAFIDYLLTIPRDRQPPVLSNGP